jgi:TetR/AcrR family transcriptional regulator
MTRPTTATTSRSASGRSAHVRAKRERRRTEVLRAALRAFRSGGYHATTLDDIALQLGVRKTALYHYFPDKEAMLYACHREGLEEVAGIIAAARRRDSYAEQLAYAIREHVRVMTDTLEGSSLAFEVTALSTRHQAEVIAARDRYEQALRDIVRRGIAAGEFRPVDAKLAVFAILGAINWIARWYSPHGSVHPPELGAQFADHLVRGLLAA